MERRGLVPNNKPSQNYSDILQNKIDTLLSQAGFESSMAQVNYSLAKKQEANFFKAFSMVTCHEHRVYTYGYTEYMYILCAMEQCLWGE